MNNLLSISLSYYYIIIIIYFDKYFPNILREKYFYLISLIIISSIAKVDDIFVQKSQLGPKIFFSLN